MRFRRAGARGKLAPMLRAPRPLAARLALTTALALSACRGGADAGPKHRERSADRDRACADPARPQAYFYPAKDRTHYEPDDPWKDGCALLVPDHLFCCPNREPPHNQEKK